ncbi:hypothetical protein [Streptomyces gobitricini]|uniref:Uncharacterized protein n=1 Tax=Streptomyces gobitricini TaxID=68211 RepID=A0ABN3L6K0_9ACTN
MDDDASAGSAASALGRLALGHLALGPTPPAFGAGGTGVLGNVTASDAASLATRAGGVTLSVSGASALRATASPATCPQLGGRAADRGVTATG